MKNTLSARSARLAVLAVSFLGSALPALAQSSLSFITKNVTNSGLTSNNVFGVYASGTTIYAATVNDGPNDNGALSISTNGGTSWTNYTRANGLGANLNDVSGVYASGSTIYAATEWGGVSISTNGGGNWTNTTMPWADDITYGVYASGSTVYAATYGGVSISTDGGGNWTNYTTGLSSNRVGGVYASGGTIYAATYSYQPGDNDGGVSISTNGGTSWTNYTTTNGLGSNNVFDVYARGSTIYAATLFGGVSISTNGGTSWTNYTTDDGLGSNIVFGVYATDSAIYAATDGGLSISTDGGLNWTNYTTADGLGSDTVRGVYASGGNIYAATTGGLSISFSTTPTLYWLGSNGTLWSAGNNWSSNATGTPTANFASGADIIFSATGSTNSTATDLGGDRSIASLTIDSTSPVGISGGNLTVSGVTTINNGTLTIGNGGTTGALIGDITNNATLVFNRSNDSTYSGSISGTGNLTKLGSGNLTLTGNNTIGGDTTISAGALAISNGGRVESSFTRVGDNGGNVTATVTGANSTWAMGSQQGPVELVIGNEASSDNNIVRVLNGGNITVRRGETGSVQVGAEGSNNLLEISGTNSTFDTNTAVYVGGQYNPSSNNTIEVKSGGTLNTGVGFIGRRAGATYNSVLVTGANSTWSAEGIEVGGEGTFNSMNVTAGAAVTAETAFVGARTGGSDNTLTISGNGSSLTAQYYFSVGTEGGDRNQVIVQDGALLSVLSGSAVGQSTGAQDNSVLVTGAGSQWQNTGNLDIGMDNGSTYVGTGQVTVENSGSVTVNGTTTVASTGSKLGGNGNFTSLGGTTVTKGAAFAPTGTSALNVTGDLTFSNGGNYLWNLFANSANASNAGTDFSAASTLSGGTLSVSSSNFTVNIGGTVDSTDNFWKQGHVWTVMTGSAFNLAAGENFTLALSGNSTGFTQDYFSLRSTGTALELVYVAPYIWKDPVVDNWTDPTMWDSNLVPDATTLAFIDNGGTSQLATNGDVSTLYVGKSNSGSGLQVNAGGNLTVATALIIGDAAASDNNSATVNGTGATLTSPTITVGNFGSNNSLTVSNGGDVSTASTIYLGAQSGSSDNTITVTGADSQLSGDIVVGANSGSGDVDSDNNKIVVSSGGSVTSSSLTLASSASSANNSLTVNGNGSTFAATGNITVGGAGDGNSLSVLNGGSASATNFVTLGQDATSSNNTLTVNGSGSTFNATSSTDSVIVGSSGSSNAIAISNGGRMSAGNSVYLGYGNSSANNSLTVNGSGSTLTATDNIMVGESGDNNSLTASNGAQVSADAVRLGNQTSSNNNSVTITGAGTDLTVSGTLRSLLVGNYGSNNSFTLSSGASFNSTGTGGYTLLGNNAASSNNTVLVTGANTNWESSDKIIIGFLGNNNTFTIADGATVVSKPVVGIDKQNTIIGFGNTSNNNLIITGANSSFTSADEMVVGYLGEGAITIANGGNLSAGTIQIAFQTGSKGVVNIGAFGGNTTGGTLSAADINFGSGNGTVNFNQSDNFTFAGNFTGGAGNYIYIKQLGSGTTTLTGTGSSAFADVIAEAGRLVFDGAVFDTGGKVFYIGETQSGATVELKNNAIVTAWETYIGSGENAADNTVLVGSNSTLKGNDDSSQLWVGYWNSLNNSLVISGGGRVEYGETYITETASKVKVTGTNSMLTGAEGQGSMIYLGAYIGANNTLDVENGGSVISTDTIIASHSASNNNTITVNGTGSTYTASGTITVGDLGDNNTLSVINGGAVSTQNLILGNNATADNNTATVSGAGSTINATGDITVGDEGSANSLLVTNSGALGTQNLVLGNTTASANNTVTVNGSGSTFAATGNITVAKAGSGTLEILNGGNLSAGTIHIASQTGSKGVVNIGTFGGNTTGGALSAATINFGGGNGTVNFNQSDNLTFAGNFTGGANVFPNNSKIQQLGSGTTTLTGTGSDAYAAVIAEAGRLVFDGAVFDIGIDLISGDAQNGATVELKNNAIVTVQEATIGYGQNVANNTILVGSNSTLRGADDSSVLYVSNWNGLNNSLNISNGGRVEFGETSIADRASKVKVSGAGSTLTGADGVGSKIYLGAYSGANNTLEVENGGSVISTNTILADRTASNNNTITVNGTGSTYTASGNITVGDLGDDNALSVINGGAVSTQNLILGNTATAANNSATVSGAGSTITATGNTTVGKAGSGTLEILNGGNLSAGTIQIASQSGSTGTVNIGAFGGNTTGGTLSASNIAFGNGTGALNFNQSGNVTIAANLTGGGANSTVNQLGSGTTLLTGNSTYTGEVNIDAGTLATNSGNALGLADVSLNAGTFDLLSGLTIGSFVWNSSGILALDDVDQSQNNFLTVNGSFTLAGSTGNGSHLFDLRNFTLGVDPSKLVAFEEGITETDLNRFGIQNLSNYEFLIQNDALWVKLAALIVNGTTTIEQGSNLTYPLALFDEKSKLVIPGGSPSTTLNFAGNLTVTNNSTVMSNGSLAIANPYVIIVDQGSTLAGSGNVTASKVIVNGQLGDTTSNGGMTIHGDLDINTTGSYLWNLYANSANASRAGTDFSAALTVNGTTTLTGNSTFSMYFDPTTVDYLNDFWDFNQSWVVMNGTTISGNLSTAFVANSAPGFSANTFRITNNGTTLLLSYLAPRIDDPTDISPTGDTNLPSYNSEPVKLVIDAPPTGTAVLANSNPSLTSIVLNSGSLISPTNTAIPENANVTVNDGTMGFQGDGVNYINGLLLTGGSLGTGGNTTVAVKSFLVTGGQLAGGGNATYWADNYLFQAVAPAKVDAKLDNLGTVAGFNSTALITTPITPGAASAPVVFDTNMLYSGNTTIAGGILQLGSGTSGDINLAAGSSITLNNKDGYSGVLNYGSNANRLIMNNVVTGNGTIGQVGTGTLTITDILPDDGVNPFGNFTGNFAAANGKLAFNNVTHLGNATGFNLSSNGTLQVDTGVTALSQNLSVTSGTGIVDNNTGVTLALNGTLAKTGSVLVLTGGNFEINGAIVGNSGSFNSDMVYDAATATINVPGVYLGPTFVQGGSTVTSGVANALPTDTVLHVGVATDGAVTNTFDLSTFDQTVAGIASAGSASNIITSTGGDLTVNGAQSTTYNGLITGPLALTRAGTGSTSLGGANTYSGGTTINAGRIITTSASALGTGAVVLNGGALQVMQTLQISSLNWAGNSAVIALPNAYGTNAYLDVAGAITLGNPSGNTFDLTGTALDGTPTKLLGSGVTALSAASFAATGVNPAYDYELYTQGNDLWLRILSTEIEVSGPNSYTTINVNGAYTMSGVLTVTETGGYTLQYGDQYLFLTAAGGITGEYSSIDMPEKFRARLLLGNNNTTAKILVAPDTYTRVAITQNQKNAAKALDSFIPATSGDREAVSLALDLQTAAQYPYAFDQIAPGFYESLANILIEQTYNQAQLLTQRLGSVRLGATGFQAIGMNQPIKYDKDGKSTADAKTASPIVESAIDTNWNSWVIANGEFSLSRGLSGVPNYNNNAGGFLVGADYRLSENFAAGLFAGYEYSYAKYNGGSSTRGNSALFGLYGTYTHEDGYYADAMVSGGYTGLQTRRSIEFSTIDRTASADPNSGQFSAALNLGKDFEIGKFTLGPIVGAQYTYVGIGGFTESGADSLDLALGQQNANSFRTNLGARLAYNLEVGSNITLIPEVRGFWMHEFLNNPRNISSALEGGSGPSFDYETSAPYRNSVFGGAGISANFADRWSASVFYNVNFGGDGYTNNIISTSLGLSF